MRDHERYLFDLNGYLVLRDVLSGAEVASLRSEIRAAGIEAALASQTYLHAGFPPDYYDDAASTGDRGYRYSSDSYLLDWGPAVRSLVAHPRLLEYVAAMVGSAFRLDHAYGIFSRGETQSHALHNGATPFDPTQVYMFRDGQMHNAMIVVQFALTSVEQDSGGFCCIPGSHKANYALPKEMPSLDELDDDWRPVIQSFSLEPGDVLIFTEAVTHGALPWRGSGDRMALLYKYCQGAMQWERNSPFVTPGHDWTPIEHRVMTGPYAGGRPSVTPDCTDEIVDRR